MAIQITLINWREPYELRYYQECDKTEKLEEKVFHLENEISDLQEILASWKTMFRNKTPEEKLADKEWIACTISRLQYLLEELDGDT